MSDMTASDANMMGGDFPKPLHVDAEELRLVTPYFDADYYLASNVDVAHAAVDPLEHFMTHGWREGRDPSINFSVTYYLRANPDVESVGINPLLHYVLSGRSEGRRPSRLLHSERIILEEARPLSIREQEWMAESGGAPSLGPDVLKRALEAVLQERSGLIVSVSHDDYQTNVGGVQNLVREERFGFEKVGCAYLHLSPATAIPNLAPHNSAVDFYFSLRLGSDHLGLVRSEDLLQALSSLRRVGIPLAVVVHHLLGTAPEVVEDIAALSSIPAIIWVHDYFTVCANYNLLRNDVRFCGAPPLDSRACGVCVYGEDREAIRPRIEAFFRTALPIVLAPSEAALSLWLSNAGLPYQVSAAQPLARIVLASHPSPHGVPPNRPLRIAHLGARLASKGWLAFERLVLRFAGDSRYEFFQLGVPGPGVTTGAVRNVPVRVTSEAPDAMIEAVAEHRIDAVVCWSTWPETFCYAAHEAVAAGAFLLTHPGAGNVPALVAGPAAGQGLILPDEEALHALLEQNRLGPMLSTGRRRGVLVREGGTAAWLLRSAEWPRFHREMALARANNAAVEA
jgi:hypothetical protein